MFHIEFAHVAFGEFRRELQFFNFSILQFFNFSLRPTPTASSATIADASNWDVSSCFHILHFRKPAAKVRKSFELT